MVSALEAQLQRALAYAEERQESLGHLSAQLAALRRSDAAREAERPQTAWVHPSRAADGRVDGRIDGRPANVRVPHSARRSAAAERTAGAAERAAAATAVYRTPAATLRGVAGAGFGAGGAGGMSTARSLLAASERLQRQAEELSLRSGRKF